MQSLNFEALRTHYTALADLGGFAEQYVHSDPVGAVVKIRILGEALIHAIYERYKLSWPFEGHFKALLSASTFGSVVPPSILSKFDVVRLEGNPGAHPGPVTQATARKLLREACTWESAGRCWRSRQTLCHFLNSRFHRFNLLCRLGSRKSSKSRSSSLRRLSPNSRACGSNTTTSRRRKLN